MNKHKVSFILVIAILCTLILQVSISANEIPLLQTELTADEYKEIEIFTAYLTEGGYTELMGYEIEKEYLNISTCMIDVNNDGINELLVSLMDTKYSNARGYATYSALLNVQNGNNVEVILSAYNGGGSMGGDHLVLRYDQIEHTYVIGLKGYYREGVYASAEYLQVYSCDNYQVKYDMEANYYNLLTYYANTAERVRQETSLYVENGEDFEFFKVNGEYVSLDEYNRTNERFIEPIDDRYQFHEGTYDNPIDKTYYESVDNFSPNNSFWNKIYYDYIIKDRQNSSDQEYWKWVTYELIYLDEDAIPELWINYNVWASGCRLATISNGIFYSTLLESGMLSYVESENKIHHSYGHMGLYFDTIFKLENGELVTASEGKNETTLNPDGTQNYNIMNYFWNKEIVSEQTYIQKINEYIDPSVAKATSSNQSVIYNYEEILMFLNSVDVDDSDPHPKPDNDLIELKAYTAFPDSTIGTQQEAKVQFSLYTNGDLTPIDEYVLGISNPSVIESIKTTDSNGSRIITLKGLKPGSSELTFTENSTGATITISVAVEDKCNFFRCSVFPIPHESSSSIYIADYVCTVDENGNHDITFNAYNTSYAYGVVEVYDENGSLLKLVPLDPRSDSSGIEKVVNGFKWVWDDIKDLFDGDTPFYTKDSNAKHTPVTLKDIPENAEILITSDGNESDFATLYTGVDVFVRTVLASSSIDLKTNEQVATVKELMNALSESLIKPTTHDETENMIKQGLIEETAESISTSIAFVASLNSVSDIYETVNNLLQSMDIDAESIILSVLKSMGYSVADATFTTAVPLYKIVNFVDQILETAWPLVDYQFNLERGKMEVHVAKHGLHNFVANSCVTVTQESNFNGNTVLDAYLVVENDELGTLSDSIPMNITNYVIYNITLREKGVEVQPNGQIEVRLPVPIGADEKKCVVYRIEENGRKTLLQSRYDNGYVIFTTTHLSYYVIGQIADSGNFIIADHFTPDYTIVIVTSILVSVLITLAIIIIKCKKANK